MPDNQCGTCGGECFDDGYCPTCEEGVVSIGETCDRQAALVGELVKACQRADLEWDLSTVDILGALECVKFEVYEAMIRREREGGDDES